jgi:hypothetical protein
MSIRNQLDQALLAYIDQVLEVCGSRAAYVINFILENGSISSEDIQSKGYVHGARAIGDVRDNGIPLITGKIKSSTGRSIAKYTFGDVIDIKKHKFGGRVAFPAKLKGDLIKRDGLICHISQQELPEDELQIDHRIPYYISGDVEGERDPADFMLLSRSMQRAKSWDCEHCENLITHFDLKICKTCYWAYPENYSHVAIKESRTVNIIWQGTEVKDFDIMKGNSEKEGLSIQEYVKKVIRENS